MKAFLPFVALLGLIPSLAFTQASAGTPPAPSGVKQDTPSMGQAFAQGLLVTEYPRHALQKDDKDQFYLKPEEFGKAIGEPFVTKSINPWRWNSQRNATATGYLEIATAGAYDFNANSFYDRNVLLIDDKVVCGFRDGPDRVATVSLQPGMVKITCIGTVESRGTDEGIHVRWKPPGQAELSVIPPENLWHAEDIAARKARLTSVQPHATSLITVANDYIVDVYQNGVKIPDSKRKLLEERFGATAERIEVATRPGDWLVFHVVHNRIRWEGSRYFAVSGNTGPNNFGFVSDPTSPEWSANDDPALVSDFIHNRDFGTQQRAKVISKLWEEGDGYMRQFAGAGYPGKALWGSASSTWIKYVAPKSPQRPLMTLTTAPAPKPEEPKVPIKKSDPFLTAPAPKPPAPTPPATTSPAQAQAPAPSMLTPKRSPVQIISATYGTGGKNADVTAVVKEFVEVKKRPFSVSPPDLGVDPNVYWNKALDIVYMKDGVKREQHRNENETVLPETFYGPQDTVELRAWLIRSRWVGENAELQFNEDRSLTGPGLQGTPLWEALSNNKLRITWSAERMAEYEFDYVWGSFREVGNAKVAFHLVK